MRRPRPTLIPTLLIGLGCVVGLSDARSQQPALAAEIDGVNDLVLQTYRSIHEYPELGNEEHRTQALLRTELERLGYRDFIDIRSAPTAVIAVLDTGRPGPTVALRAEMDARRAVEAADHGPRSRVDSLMHNCGHDAHAAVLLGAAAVLKANTGALQGRIVFLFQPAEETRGGADDIVAAGVLDSLGVEALFAQHATPGLPVGAVSVSPGSFLAGSSYFTLTLRGAGSHAAVPFEGGDLPLAAAKIAQGLSELPARRLDILARPVVLSVTNLHAGDGSSNVLPESATLSGTIRAFEPIGESSGDQPSVEGVIHRYLDGTSAALGVTYELDLRAGPPPTRNDPALFAAVVPALRAAWPGAVDETPYRGMFAEDFAYYTAVVPSLYFGWGVARDGLGDAGVHTSAFTIHPDALAEGVRLLVLLAQLATTGEVELR